MNTLLEIEMEDEEHRWVLPQVIEAELGEDIALLCI